MDVNTFFDAQQQILKASAPGRLDVMGGIADYSGSLVLQMPIKEKTTAFLARRQDQKIRIYSEQTGGAIFECSINNWPKRADLFSSDFFRTIRNAHQGNWVLYPLGCIITTLVHKDFDFAGIDLYFQSEVPLGKGVSSSAALEMATLNGLNALYQLDINPITLAKLGQQAEHVVVGAPCGLMDQLASNLGKKDHLLPILCQPHFIQEPVSIPVTIQFIGLDSGVKHAVSGQQYGQVRAATFMGYSIIAQASGFNFHSDYRDNWPYDRYLAKISKKVYFEKYHHILPEQLSGQDFLDQYKFFPDTISKLDPDLIYNIRKCTAHPILENHNIHQFQELLRDENPDLIQLGQFMYAAHEGYGKCGLGHPNTDFIVDAVKKLGAKRGFYGARISGGGCGGTVVIMKSATLGNDDLQALMKTYESKYSLKPCLFEGSSEGASYANPQYIS